MKILFRLYLYLKERFDPTPVPIDEELFCRDICTQLIDYPGTRLTYAPISNKRFLKNDAKEMFVVIDHRVISIINHVYGYTIMIENDKVMEEIVDKFDNVLEARRLELENEMRSNIKHSLQTILDKLKN